MRAPFAKRAQRGGQLAQGCLVTLFRFALFLLFAPIAVAYAMRGAWFECVLAALLAFYLGALLAPGDSD
jgi:hypothetical protein